MTRDELFESLGRPLFESLGCPLHEIGDLRTPSPGADDVPGCEDGHGRELHESSLAPSL